MATKQPVSQPAMAPKPQILASRAPADKTATPKKPVVFTDFASI
jgi:hypothetical protein